MYNMSACMGLQVVKLRMRDLEIFGRDGYHFYLLFKQIHVA